ncbi:hypothetical protein ES703_38778 [subsurface metagenome]
MTGCFHRGAIVQGLRSSDKYDAIKELIQKAPVFSKMNNREVEEAVIQREKILSTGLGRGVALAHGTTPAVKEIMIALGISQKGIKFDSFDNAPVHPEKKVEYLSALAAVTSLVRDDEFRASLYAPVPAFEIEKKISQAFQSCLKRR